MKLFCGHALLNTILQIFTLLLVFDEIVARQNKSFSKHIKRKYEMKKEYQQLKQKHIASNLCTAPRRKVDKTQHLSRHPRSARQPRRGEAKSGSALYFSGKEILKLKTSGKYSHVKLPNGHFTVELWVKPEGGQFDPVTILGLVDICDADSFQTTWELGIKSDYNGNLPSSVYFFSLKTDLSRHFSNLKSHRPFISGHWSYIVVTYDERYLRLYVNNAMVSVSQEQRGKLFQTVSRRCKEFHLGGDVSTGNSFRGTIDDLRLWNKTLSHEEIGQSYRTFLSSDSDIIMYDNFNNIKLWRKLTRDIPVRISSDILDGNGNVLVKTPPCGETICDDPTLVKSYLINEQLKKTKEIRYKVINIMNDDGTNPTVTTDQIQTQHRALLEAFSPYNITWRLRQENIRNTSLRQKGILFVCDPSNVGDGTCQRECQHSRTGNDGGDCAPFINNCVVNTSLANGRCDFECNKEYHNWDGGDCCLPGPNVHITCFDPSSPNRGYLGVNELKDVIAQDSSTHLNVFVSPNTLDQLLAVAVLPWDKDLFGVQGGLIIRAEEFGLPGRSGLLVHEIGHVLGLYHVHHGISEMECNDPCLETHASMELGDLCSDTAPTPNNTYCRDPDGSQTFCGISAFQNTPFRNYMSYADDNCSDHFTLQQAARMHCYLDLVYQSWSMSKVPAPVPLQPKVVWANTKTVKLSCLPPLGSTHVAMSSVCDLCDDSSSVSQYAVRSNSSHNGDSAYIWKSMEAEGPPDAESCEASPRAWMPDTNDYLDCEIDGCYLDLEFQYPVIPNRLTLWVIWNALETIDNIELCFTDGSSEYLGLFPTTCDTPLTILLSVTKRVSRIRVYVANPYVAVDAAEITTADDYTDCLRCRSRKYKISRDPPFSTGPMMQTSEPYLLDSDVESGQSYNYSIMVSVGSRESEISPVLHYTHGQPICGDGIINGEPIEACDDGNLSDGDGCNVYCQIEELFHCGGQPSSCYKHDGDGICEEFERRSSVQDCGFYTPENFEDQWAISATANPSYQDDHCPETNITGVPDANQICKSYITESDSVWYPCGHQFEPSNFWIEVYFARAVIATEVIIHLASVGRMIMSLEESPFIRVELISISNTTRILFPEKIDVSCRLSPIHVTIHQDLSRPFILTRGVRIRFASYNLSFAGVRLRSSRLLDPVTISTCTEDEVYNPRSGQCVVHNCPIPYCTAMSVPNSIPTCSGYREGDTCRLTCHTGFMLNNTYNELICLNGSWISPIPLACVPIDCGTPEIPHAMIACRNGTTLGNKCIFRCKPPSVLEGNETNIRCEADGHWSEPTSSCHVKCHPPLMIRNSKLATKSCKRGYHSVGKRCKFKCRRGYHVENKKPTKKRLKIICGGDGKWKGGICTRISCPPIDLVFTGLYTCTNLQFSGSICTLRCDRDVQVITCSQVGKWSGSFRMCPSIGTSGVCNEIANTNDLIYKCNGNSIGDQCRVSCLLPSANPIQRGRMSSQRAGQMDIPVRQLTCTALSVWQPNPDTLQCLKTCDNQFVRDGWCDANNNNARCKWDGGDCCASSAPNNEVNPFPVTCTDDCRCLDPMAEENIRKHKRKRKKFRRRKSRKKSSVNNRDRSTLTSQARGR